MQKMNKKAVSNIIATVSILLLALVLIYLVSLTVSKIVSAPQLAPQLSCLEMQTSFPIEIQKSCYNTQTKEIEVTVKRKLATNLTTFDFVLTTPAESSAWCVGLSCCETCELLSEGEVKTYFIPEELDANETNKVGIMINDCLIQTKNINSC